MPKATKKVMARLWEHEKHRWGYMTVAQLETRVKKIKNLNKLQCCIRAAKHAGNWRIHRLAVARKKLLLGV